MLSKSSYPVEILRKKIKHMYIRVDHSALKIIVSVPRQVNPWQINDLIFSKQAWIEKQIKKGAGLNKKPVELFLTSDYVIFQGRLLYFQKLENQKQHGISIGDHHTLNVSLKKDFSEKLFLRNIDAWLRSELKRLVNDQVAKWEPLIGVKVNEVGIRKMKTRWGSCNIQAKRIWINFSLIHLEPCFLSYVVVHEMIHLIERKHNMRFKNLMFEHVSNWPDLKEKMNEIQL